MQNESSYSLSGRTAHPAEYCAHVALLMMMKVISMYCLYDLNPRSVVPVSRSMEYPRIHPVKYTVSRSSYIVYTSHQISVCTIFPPKE